MSQWTNIKAVIDINIDNLFIRSYDCKGIAKIEHKILLFFATKFMGSEGDANVYCNFDKQTSTFFGFDDAGNSVVEDCLCRCSVTISGAMKDKSKDEVIEELKSILEAINKDEDIYVEYWNSIGTIWEFSNDEESKTDIYPILEEMCKDK